MSPRCIVAPLLAFRHSGVQAFGVDKTSLALTSPDLNARTPERLNARSITPPASRYRPRRRPPTPGGGLRRALAARSADSYPRSPAGSAAHGGPDPPARRVGS